MVSKINERIYWIDWAKALGIWLVVFGHAPAKGHIFIYMFHMPFFFIISGFLYKKGGFTKEVKKITRGLLYPYLIYNFILLIVAFLIGDFQNDMICNILLGNQEGISVRYFSPLWFLVALSLMRLMSSIIISQRLIILAFICIIVSVFLYNGNYFSYDFDYFQFCTTLICFPFFLFGRIIKLNFDKFNLLKISSLWFVLGWGILAWIGYYNGPVNIFRATMAGDSIIVFYLVGGGLSFILLKLISIYLNKKCELVEYISKGTLFILCTHQFVIISIDKIYPLSTIPSMGLSCLICFFSIFIIKVLMQYCPIFIGK